MSRAVRALCAVAASACVAAPTAAHSQALPEIVVNADSANSRGGDTLTVPNTARATAEIERIPGAVAVVPDTEFKNTPANTIRDIIGWVPGVITQPKSNIDNRVSIRGSGLTRNYGNRGVNFYMDGIPINTSDGLTDLFEIDPSAYRYVEVYKGANALRYGGNALGGAVNFVTPTGRSASPLDARLDAGSFGLIKGQVSTGGASGPADWFLNLSAQREDGYREHSNGHLERFNGNIGYRIAPDVETRFYLNANSWRQRLPGEVTKDVALNSPRSPDSEFVRQDQQRNIDSIRVANKTTVRLGATTLDFGLFTHQRHVDHPIFRYLDYTVSDYGGFVRAIDERSIGGFRNRLTAGVNILNGTTDYQEYVNVGNATKGALTRNEIWKPENYSVYAENAFYALPHVALVVGGQFTRAVRSREDRFLADGDQTASRTWNLFSPKVGFVWDVDPGWQVFGNISRTSEAPSFDAATFSTFAAPPLPTVEAQRATTYEIGTRGRRENFTWDLAVYRSELRNEFQCLRTSPFSLCAVVNADRTVHQGVEAGFGVAFVQSAFAHNDRVWLNVSYTYNDFRFDGDARWGNNRLPGVPPHTLRTELLYKHPGGFYAGPNVEWMPQAYFADNANTLAIDSYALLNFRVGYDRGVGWSGYLEGRNLLDTRYISATIIADIATPTSALFSPGYGRAIYGGLRYRM